jgi:hypothetical protein
MRGGLGEGHNKGDDAKPAPPVVRRARRRSFSGRFLFYLMQHATQQGAYVLIPHIVRKLLGIFGTDDDSLSVTT